MGNGYGDSVVGEDERARWRRDPVSFVRHRLGAAPWGKQREILEALCENSYVAVRSCNGSGKTFIAAHAVIWWLLCYDDAVVITTAPTERQVSELLWREIRDIHAANRELIGGRISKTRLELGPRRFAFGFATDQAERFQGFHQGHILFVVDEASGVDAEIFDAMEGSMTSRNSKMLLIGNPTALSGIFYDAFHKDRALWHTIHISAFDTPGLAPSPICMDGQDRQDGIRALRFGECTENDRVDEKPPICMDGQDVQDTDSTRPQPYPAYHVHPCKFDGQDGVRALRFGECTENDRVDAKPPICMDTQDVQDTDSTRPQPYPAYPVHPCKSDGQDGVRTLRFGEFTENDRVDAKPPICMGGQDVQDMDSTHPQPYPAYPVHPCKFDGLITPEWVERAGKRWGKNSATYQVRVLGEFPSAATDTLIPLKDIEAAIGRQFSDPRREKAVMGLDIARFGDDRSVACIRQGPAIIGLWVFPSSDIMATTGRALNLARDHKVSKINVDEVGLGAGVLDRMREIGSVEAVGINGGRRAGDPERYANLRAEMFDGLRLRFQSGDISICDDAELISELASLKYSFTSKGQIRLEDKQSLRSSGRPSPDKADAVMLAFAKGEANPLMIWI